MIYSLRKLIAFVFLGGIFWFIYRDVANIGNPLVMNTVGVLVAVFGIFWLIVPAIVVHFRIRARIAHNRERFGEWLAEHGRSAPRPLPRKTCRIDLGEGEQAYIHEKGTFYVEPDAQFDSISVRGAPGDVAFPRMHRCSRKVQRTHFYLTDRRVVFAGKSLHFQVGLDGLRGVSAAPGGLVFSVSSGERTLRMAFTFQNPLVAEEIIRRVVPTGEKASTKGES